MVEKNKPTEKQIMEQKTNKDFYYMIEVQNFTKKHEISLINIHTVYRFKQSPGHSRTKIIQNKEAKQKPNLKKKI